MKVEQVAAQSAPPSRLKVALNSLRSGTAEAQLAALDEIPSDLPHEYFSAVQSAVLQAMSAGDNRVQLRGALLLVRLGDESDPPVNVLLANLSPPPRGQESSAKCHAIHGLSYVKNRVDVIDKLIKVVERDKDSVVRERALLALAATGNDVAKLFLDHQARNGNKAASVVLTQLARAGSEGLRAAIVDGYDPRPVEAAQHDTSEPTGSNRAVEDEESPGPAFSETAEQRECDIPALTEEERRLCAAFRRAAREYEAVEQAERNRHTAFEQAKRKEMAGICDDAQRLLANVTGIEAGATESFLVRYGWAPSRDSVRPGSVHGTTGTEFSQALTGCARAAQEKLQAIRSLSTIIKVVCGCAVVLFFVLLGNHAGLAASFWVSVVAAALGSGLAAFAGCGMCGALYKNGRTAQAICARWRQSAERYCETEIEKSSEQARNTLARQLDSWQRLLSHVQEAERAIVVKGDKCAPSWSDPIWTRWKPSERKPAGVRLGNYFLRAKLPTGDNASLVVPAILSFPGDRCLLLKIGDTFVAQNQSGPESHASAEADRQQDGARHKRRGRARRIEDIEEDDDDEEEESF